MGASDLSGQDEVQVGTPKPRTSRVRIRGIKPRAVPVQSFFSQPLSRAASLRSLFACTFLLDHIPLCRFPKPRE